MPPEHARRPAFLHTIITILHKNWCPQNLFLWSKRCSQLRSAVSEHWPSSALFQRIEVFPCCFRGLTFFRADSKKMKNNSANSNAPKLISADYLWNKSDIYMRKWEQANTIRNWWQRIKWSVKWRSRWSKKFFPQFSFYKMTTQNFWNFLKGSSHSKGICVNKLKPNQLCYFSCRNPEKKRFFCNTIPKKMEQLMFLLFTSVRIVGWKSESCASKLTYFELVFLKKEDEK